MAAGELVKNIIEPAFCRLFYERIAGIFSSDGGVCGSDGRGGRDVQDQGRIKVDTAGTFADCRHLPNFQGSNSLYLIITASIIITDFP